MAPTVRHIRRPSFLDSSLRLDGVIELVNLVSVQSLYFSELARKSQIKFKKSFLKYLRYCIDQDFITKTKVSHRDLPDRYSGNRLGASHYTFYEISDKGQMFLELIK